MKLNKLTSVQWRDSNMYITQCNKNDKFEVAVIISSGYLIQEDKSKIVLAGDVMENGEVRRVIVIPKENIIKRDK